MVRYRIVPISGSLFCTAQFLDLFWNGPLDFFRTHVNANPLHTTFWNGPKWNGTISYPCQQGLYCNVLWLQWRIHRRNRYKQAKALWQSKALFTRVRYRTIPLRSVPKSGMESRGCIHMGTEKNQPVRSKTGPEIGRYGKVNQKLERYNIVPFRSCVNRSGTILYRSVLMWTDKQVQFRSTFRTCLVSTGDTKLVSMTTSNVEVEIRPNCTSLILPIVSSF